VSKIVGLNAVDFSAPRELKTKHGLLKVFTRPSPDRSSQNQDSFGALEVGSDLVMVVCDGMGGHQHGDVASRLVVEQILETVAKAKTVDSNLILDALSGANSRILTELSGSGTTACLAHLSDEGLRFYNVGDSVGYLLSKASLDYKTTEQTVAGLALETGLLDAQQAEEHPEGHHLLNCLGDETPNIEVSTLIEASKAIVVLATDGFTQSVDQSGFVSQAGKVGFDEFYDFMLKHAFDGMEASRHYDDLTFLALEVN
jgi:serine/threonine protein phosphatase PrpC